MLLIFALVAISINFIQDEAIEEADCPDAVAVEDNTKAALAHNVHKQTVV
jgi:hypothetical protein